MPCCNGRVRDCDIIPRESEETPQPCLDCCKDTHEKDMTTTIANPIYDLAFKYLMEDERVVKILLSALLRKRVVEVTTRRNEVINVEREPVSVFRLDYNAVVAEADGREEHILIELQKTDLPTDLLRFRQYLGTQYLSKENMVGEEPRQHARPMVAIYLLGHRVGAIEEPVLYVTPGAENYEGKRVTQGIPDPFVDSLTHSSIIVQIPLLHGKVGNHVERLLNVFDQSRQDSLYPYLINIDEADYAGNEELKLIVTRLQEAGSKKEIRERMKMEELLLRDYENMGVEILRQKKQLQEQSAQLEEQSAQLEEQSAQLEEQSAQLEEQSAQLEKQSHQLRETIRLLLQASVPIDVIAARLNITVDKVEELKN